MKNTPNLLSNDAELWESRQLGATEKYVKRMGVKKSREIDVALGLETVSFRLEKELADKLRKIAQKEGIGYRPMIRHILTKYVQEKATQQSKRRSA